MEKIDGFLKFIDKTPNAYFCVSNLKEQLIENGFEELYENEVWNNLKKDGKYFVIRNDSSIIAFKMTDIYSDTGFNIVASHSDSPSFSIKPNANMYENGYLKLNISSYGSMINYTWLDRPLSLAGRVVVYNGESYKKMLFNLDKDLLIIPSQAIHINRKVNEKLALNYQDDMLPIMSLSDNKLEDIIKDRIAIAPLDKICDYDLYLYNRDKARIFGLNDEFISAPRLDNLASVYPTFNSFIDSYNQNSINVFCVFNNEEIGSLTEQGADSTFLIDILTRITKCNNMDLFVSLSNSFIISSDNAHAIHPNAAKKNDPTNKVLLNGGIVVKNHVNYTTNALTASIFKGICESSNVPYQDFACKSDLKCGTTLGGVSQRHVSIDSIDIGISQLAMHSANETIGSKDILYMYKAILEFYKSLLKKEKNIVKVLK